MNTLIAINNQTVGRDRIARLLQYLSRVLWHRLQQNNKEGVNALKNLEFQLGTFRRLLRLGRCVDVLYSTIPLLKYPEHAVRFTVVLSKICTSLFLLADHILWFGRADICTVNIDKWSSVANEYWLYSIIWNLVRDFYEIGNIIKNNKRNIVPASGIQNVNDFCTLLARIFVIFQSNHHIVIDTVKNGCDLFIPLAAMGHVMLKPGTVGWLGVISSIAGLIVLIQPSSKLSPA